MPGSGQAGEGVAPGGVYPGYGPQNEGAAGHAGMGELKFGGVDYLAGNGNEVNINGAVSVCAVGATVGSWVDALLYLLQQAV